MAALSPSPAVLAPDHRAQERRTQDALRALSAPEWEQRLQPLAVHMVDRRLVRARSEEGAALRHLDLDVLPEALSQLLRAEWESASLIVELVVEGADPAVLTAERGVSRPVLVEQLREAVAALATRYERLANGDLDDWPAALVRHGS